MKYLICAVKDEMVEKFLQPTFVEDELTVTRIFRTQINNLPIWKDNPSDFSLYQLGTFDEETGEITAEIHKIISGHAVKEFKKEDNNDI